VGVHWQVPRTRERAISGRNTDAHSIYAPNDREGARRPMSFENFQTDQYDVW